MKDKFIYFYDEVTNNDVSKVGGKNASLGEMYQNLTCRNVYVPFGFATSAYAYEYFIKEAKLKKSIKKALNDLDPANVQELEKTGKYIREIILGATMPTALLQAIKQAYEKLCDFYKDTNLDVAVRSSATAEDLPTASFAGQQESFLNVRGAEELILYVQKCYASLFTDRAISYRYSNDFYDTKVSLCVGIQKMVRSDKACSGVMFSIDPDSGSDRLIVINGIWGLGENIVGGVVNPDEFKVFKPTLKKGYKTLLKRKLGRKRLTMVYDEKNRTKNIDTSLANQQRYSLSDDEAMQLAKYAYEIEKHYKKPMDIEWAKDGIDGEFFIVQARPETVHSKQKKQPVIKTYKFKQDTPKAFLVGTAVGEKIGSGKVHLIKDKLEFKDFQKGEILVTDNTDPDWEPIMKIASGVVTNRGGRTCHAAIVAREIGIPAIVGTSNATEILKDAQMVTISCAEGEEGYVYEGDLEFYIDELNLGELKEPKTKLYMNVGDPSKAFGLSSLPNHGVGLARMEFIINSAIKAHPNALIDLNNGKKVDEQQKIQELIKDYDNSKEFFVDNLAKGIATIAAAFYPKPVIVRTSDFKSNEYKYMLGGKAYEPEEENPMIGYRGASRYYSKEYEEAFKWECLALKRVRDEMGLTNLIVMLPFVRTPKEGQNVIDIMATQGLKQGINDLKIYAMCEIPSNVILADEFLKIFDGYSIGSNDLTQLTLGVDRDSDLVAHVFDERDEAVKRMLKMAIQACKKEDKYIGICGQAPSDYPEIAKFLVENGIDSLSLNPDSILKTWKLVVDIEK